MSFIDTKNKITLITSCPGSSSPAGNRGIREALEPHDAVCFALDYLDQCRKELWRRDRKKTKSQRTQKSKGVSMQTLRQFSGVMVGDTGGQGSRQVRSAQEHVSSVFTPANFTGIRSLPNALSPYFRELLYQELVQSGKRAATAPKDLQNTQGHASLKFQVNSSIPMEAAGQIPDGRFCLSRGSFTTFPYKPSEYEQQRWLRRMEALLCRVCWMSSEDFIVKSVPPSLRASTAFSTFRHMDDPFEVKDGLRKVELEHARGQILFGPLKAGGKVNQKDFCKIRAKECLAGLSHRLSVDWPHGFLQAFVDVSSGNFILSFNCQQCSSQGDLFAYMNQLAMSHMVVQEFNLRKDAHKWGLVDQETDTVFFVFVSPWGKYNPKAPVKSAQRCARRFKSKLKKLNALRPAMDAYRIPFGDLTHAGLLKTTCTRPFNHGFRY